MTRRRENRVGSCLECGAVLGIFIEGETPTLEAHDCPFVDHGAEVDRNDLNDLLAEMRAARGDFDAEV